MLARILFVFCLFSCHALAAPFAEIDLNTVTTEQGVLQRIYGSDGDGSYGVPVTGGFDMDGDTHNDYAIAAMTASPLARNQAGIVFLVFGDGTIGGSLDTASSNPRVLKIYGAAAGEHAGSEVWMSRVTTSQSENMQPLGDLIICRQDYSGPSKIGSGALTIIPGQAMLKTLAESVNGVIDLSLDNSSLGITTLVGANAGDRLCMWARTGDLSGDGVDDIAIGADQEDRVNGEATIDDAGAVYLLRGGAHLSGAGTVDLAQFEIDGTSLSGDLMRVRLPLNPYADYMVGGESIASPIDKSITSPNDATNFHFGATLNIAKLDDNNQAELLVASSLNRAGGVLSPSNEGSGGSLDGTVYIIWGDNFVDTWATNTDLQLDNLPGSLSVIDGADGNNAFGEELLGGLDFNNDGAADLYVGDLTGNSIPDLAESRTFAGTGHVIYSAEQLKNQLFDWQSPIPALQFSNFLGPLGGAIDGDTAMQGDFNGDGIDDLAVSAPHDRPFGRTNAGTLHVMLGKDGGNWPQTMDFNLSNFPSSDEIQVVNYYGAKGSVSGNTGDTLAYSGDAGDIDKDGYADIITNEMVGDGIAANTVDVGNLIIISGKGFADSLPEPMTPSEPCDLMLPIKSASGALAVVCL